MLDAHALWRGGYARSYITSAEHAPFASPGPRAFYAGDHIALAEAGKRLRISEGQPGTLNGR